MAEAARLRATKKIMILTNQYVIRKAMLLHFCLVTSCPYQPYVWILMRWFDVDWIRVV
jgi:hypothetical protein